jgi:hypothetical protein
MKWRREDARLATLHRSAQGPCIPGSERSNKINPTNHFPHIGPITPIKPEQPEPNKQRRT